MARARQQRPERTGLLVVSLYRYFSFMIAVGMAGVWAPLRGEPTPVVIYVVLGIVGAYLIFNIFPSPFPQSTPFAKYAFQGLDMAVAFGAMISTGALESPLLLYSLSPILRAAMLLEEPTAWATAAISSLSSLVAAVSRLGLTAVSEPVHLTTFLLYTIASALLCAVAFRTNFNLRRQLENQAITEERARLRRELHDNLAQDVGFMNLTIKNLQGNLPSGLPKDFSSQISTIERSMQKTYTDVRNYLDALDNPSFMLLAPALDSLVRDFSQRTGITVQTSVALDPRPIPLNIKSQVLAIAQETLNNIYKHAQTQKASLALTHSQEGLELTIEDKGIGFTPDGASLSHYGIRGMQERAQEIGATIQILSYPGSGTRIRLTVPL